MHKKLTIVLLLVVLGLTACKSGKNGKLSTGEYEVLSAYIAEKFTEDKRKDLAAGVVRIVICDRPSSGEGEPLQHENGQRLWERTKSLQASVTSLQSTTTDSFRKANARPAWIDRSLHSPMDYELVAPTQFLVFFENNGGDWPAYYKRYPGSQGFATFSRVGFNTDGTQALFYLSNRCGVMCWSGTYVVMEKRNGLWIIEKELSWMA